MAKTGNPFDMFKSGEVKTAKIEALGGAEIKYRELTMAESDAFAKRLVKDYGTDGSSPVIDFDAANEIKYEKAATILVDPPMTVEQLKQLSGSAMAAITEINNLVEKGDDMVDEAGN
jgi:hypothetical protein